MRMEGAGKGEKVIIMEGEVEKRKSEVEKRKRRRSV
jgi:hypothetical protein